ncbi:hypothetical protein I313_01153, partial [Cryptococcus deuterogattii Ram5]
MLNLLDLHRPPVQKESSIVVGPSKISLYLLQPGQTQRAKSSNNNIRLVQFSQSSTPISEDQSLSPVEAPPPPPNHRSLLLQLLMTNILAMTLPGLNFTSEKTSNIPLHRAYWALLDIPFDGGSLDSSSSSLY